LIFILLFKKSNWIEAPFWQPPMAIKFVSWKTSWAPFWNSVDSHVLMDQHLHTHLFDISLNTYLVAIFFNFTQRREMLKIQFENSVICHYYEPQFQSETDYVTSSWRICRCITNSTCYDWHTVSCRLSKSHLFKTLESVSSTCELASNKIK